MAQFEDKISKISADYADLEKQYSTGNCWKLSTTMQELEEAMREHIQAITRREIDQVIKKLKSNDPLDQKEMNYIKLWVCGDAEYYVHLENNYKDWTDEIKRLVGEIKKINTEQLDFDTSSRLRAMLLDGIRVLGDIMFYAKQQERLNNFAESTKELDADERTLLIRLLEGKFASPDA